MSEPPVLPADDSIPPRRAEPAVGNPYAPGRIESSEPLPNRLPRLPAYYWGALAVAFALTALACYFVPGVGIPAAIGLVSAVIRVPWMRARPRPASMRPIPQPIVHLLISWIFCLFFGFAAICIFCMVCFPLGLMTFGLAGEATALPMVFGVSGILGLLVYLYLFRLSLRMSW